MKLKSNIKYRGIHKYVREHKEKVNFCECCQNFCERLDLANINGIYDRDLNNYRWLCRRCHMLSDNRLENSRNRMIMINATQVKHRDSYGRFIE